MILHIYAVCHNEEILLPYFLRHYAPLAEKIVIFDGASTDRSREIMREFVNVEIVPSESVLSHEDGKYSEAVLMGLRNEAYKASRGRADWVAVVDIDEILYHPDLGGILERYRREGISLPKISGFDMLSNRPPVGTGPIYQEFRTGFRNDWYSKRALFSPEIDIRFEPGCHRCDPQGPVKESDEAEIRLLHYRFLGAEFFLKKYLLRQERMSEESRSMGWGTHLSVPGQFGRRPLYPCTPEELEERYREIVDRQTLEIVV